MRWESGVAKVGEMTAEQEAAWQKWVEDRPEPVRTIARRLRPDTLYRLKTTGQRGIIYFVSEDGTVTMDFPAAFNPLDFLAASSPLAMVGLQVFGINPDDVEECDDLRTGLESLSGAKP